MAISHPEVFRRDWIWTTANILCFEDREQITNLTFGRLIATLQVSHDQTLQPKTLWEKVDAIMTDTITKNTEVEETIAKALDSSHIPLYLLCKTYTVEALDKSSLEVLNEIAKSVKQQEIFEKSTLHWNHFSVAKRH